MEHGETAFCIMPPLRSCSLSEDSTCDIAMVHDVGLYYIAGNQAQGHDATSPTYPHRNVFECHSTA